jgi:hypothetical protein
MANVGKQGETRFLENDLISSLSFSSVASVELVVKCRRASDSAQIVSLCYLHTMLSTPVSSLWILHAVFHDKDYFQSLSAKER